MKAIVVAAGMGRRLAPYTDEMPKCLVPVGGRPMLARALGNFRAVGVDDAVVVRGYKAEVLEARKAELGPGVRFIENLEYRDNNILESLFCARAELDGPFLFSYADIVFARDVVEDLAAADGDICLVVDRDFASLYDGRTEHPLSEAEVCAVGDDGSVTLVGKRALPAELAWGEFIGLAKFSAAGAQAMVTAWDRVSWDHQDHRDAPWQRAPKFRQAYVTDLLQYLIDGGLKVTAVPIHGRWREIDTVQDLDRAEAASAGWGDW